MQHRQNRCPQFLISTGCLGSPLHIGHRNGEFSTGVVEMMFSDGNPHSSSAVPHCVEQRIGLPFGLVFSRRSSYWNCCSLGNAERNSEYAININLIIKIKKKLKIEYLTVANAAPYIAAAVCCLRFVKMWLKALIVVILFKNMLHTPYSTQTHMYMCFFALIGNILTAHRFKCVLILWGLQRFTRVFNTFLVTALDYIPFILLNNCYL